MRLFYTLVIGVPVCLALNVVGVLFCLTLVGIPAGFACFMAASKVLTLR